MGEPASAAGALSAHARIVAWSDQQFAARAYELMVIYSTAMGYPASAAGYRADTARRHVANAGFEARVALDERDRPIGFGYGYTTRPGQWWHDLVNRAVDPKLRLEWMTDAFELSEIHVLPEAQGHGTGRRLLLNLCSALPHRAILLSTPDAAYPRVSSLPCARLRRPGPQLPVPRRRPAVRRSRGPLPLTPTS